MLLLYTLILCSVVDSARILGVYPIPAISHQVVFRALTMELTKRGHELIIITTDPALPKDRPKDNITEIYFKNAYLLKKNYLENIPIQKGKFNRIYHNKIAQLVLNIFNDEQVIELLNDKKQKFDLVIAEDLTNSQFIFAKIFDAPLIAFLSMCGFPETFDITGAVARHPTLYPHIFRKNFNHVSIFDKIKNIYNEYEIMRSFSEVKEYEVKFLKTKFGNNAPSIDDLQRAVSMVFLSSFPMFCNNRPVPPNVVYLGALHLQPVKELPEDFKNYLDSSKQGVVYVSLGTNILPSMMDRDMLDAFLIAFKQLPYDILWKFDGDHLDNVPENVRIQKWFPQRDLLVHSNIKAFVTQGGLQSTGEAIDAEVPLVGIPFMNDQWYNVNKYKELGIGVALDTLTLSADDIIMGVKSVTSQERYKQNIKKLKTIMNDTPQTSMERAVWWTEYVLRHKGASHLKSPATNMSYREYFMVDIILGVVAVLVVVIIILVYIAYYVVSLFKSNLTKIKLS